MYSECMGTVLSSVHIDVHMFHLLIPNCFVKLFLFPQIRIAHLIKEASLYSIGRPLQKTTTGYSTEIKELMGMPAPVNKSTANPYTKAENIMEEGTGK